MTKRRQTIARRLVEAQQTAAMLTTFNEADMTAIMALRERRKESFKKEFGVGLGIASFFVKASIAALRAFPALNAEIQGDEIVYKHYFDIGMAVGAEGGLVVPVIRDADRMNFPQIEIAIREFAKKATDGTLTLEDLRGGTFTITNGGVFGSLLSTPILNPPQVAILGLHKIQDRVVPLKGQPVDPANDVSGAVLRSSDRRWPRGRAVSGQGEGLHRGPGQPAARGMRTVSSMRMLLSITLLALLATSARRKSRRSSRRPPDLRAPPNDAVKSPTGLISKTIKPGTSSEKPIATDVVTVNYTGWRSDGMMFDSTVARGTESTFPLDRVMAGWRECVILMTIGETRRCWVPQALAYNGRAGRPTGTVVFDIELVDFRPSPLIRRRT